MADRTTPAPAPQPDLAADALRVADQIESGPSTGTDQRAVRLLRELAPVVRERDAALARAEQAERTVAELRAELAQQRMAAGVLESAAIGLERDLVALRAAAREYREAADGFIDLPARVTGDEYETAETALLALLPEEGT